MPKVYTRLVLSGGETKGLAQLGALHYFWENGQLSHESVTHYAGASVGSLITLLLVCGYTPFEIWTHVYGVESLFSLRLPSSSSSLFSSYGLMSVDGVIGKVRELVEARYDPVPTLAELFQKTQKTFVVSVTNLTDQHVEYCSYETTPHLSCLDAVRASCSIPGLFKSIRREGSVYVDGSILDNLPARPIDDGRSPLLGIVVSGSNVTINDSDPNNFITYIGGIIALTVKALTNQTIHNLEKNCTILELSVTSIAPWEFMIKAEKRRDLFFEGYKKANEMKEEEFLTIVTAPKNAPKTSLCPGTQGTGQASDCAMSRIS